MARRRHQNKDIERVLQEAESGGWLIEVPRKGYWKLKCRCEERHYRTVALTPSGANYATNLRRLAAKAILLEGD